MDTFNTSIAHNGEIVSPDQVKRAVFTALRNASGFAATMDHIYREFCRISGDTDGTVCVRKYVTCVMHYAAEWWDDARFCLLADYQEIHGEDCDLPQWAALPGFNAIQSGFNSFRQKVARQTGGITFTVNRLTASKVLAGENSKPEIQEPKPARAKKQETASAKSSATKRAAEGASVDSAESGATTLEKVAGDRAMAAAAIVQALKAFPDLVTDKNVAAAIDRALATQSAKVTNVTKARTKAA